MAPLVLSLCRHELQILHPSIPYSRCIKTDVVAVAESPEELNISEGSWKVQERPQLTYDTGLYSVRHKQNRTVLLSDQATDWTTRGYFPKGGSSFSLLHMIWPRTNQPSNLVDVERSFSRRLRVQLKNAELTYYCTTHLEGSQVCY
jgi:hypothetical protein